MKHALAIAARDLRERMFVFVVSAIVAVMPFGIFLSRGAVDRSAVILVGGMAAALGVTFGVALVVGGSMIGRDLAERRLSFYFSKPVAAPAIWFGKLAGALITIAVTFAIIFIPSYLAARSAWPAQFSGSMGSLVTMILVAAASGLLIVHFLSTVIRSRSPLVALDVVLLIAAIFAMAFVVRPLLANYAISLVKTLETRALFAIPIAIALGGAWQLSRGRTDIRRSHLELSRFFWIAMFVAIASIAGYVAWVLSAGPRDLLDPVLTASPRGDFAVVTGTARDRGDYAPHFLVNARDGKAIRVPAMRWSGAEFSRNGDAVMFVQPVFERLRPIPRVRASVVLLDGTAKEFDTDSTLAIIDPAMVLSDDLTRVAILSERVLSVYDLRSHTLLGSARIAYGDDARLFFVSRDTVRVYVNPLRSRMPLSVEEMRIYEFDVSAKRLQQTGSVPAAPYAGAMRVSGDGTTAVVRSTREARIVDARTGSVRGTLRPVKWSHPIALLSNGWIAYVDVTTNAVVRIFDANGTLVRDIPLNMGPGQYFGGAVRELVPGRKLLVSVARSISGPPRADVGVLDVQTGAFERIERRVALGANATGSDPRMPAPASDLILMDAVGALWRWNPLTGAKTKIL